jgi:hypothetical protein
MKPGTVRTACFAWVLFFGGLHLVAYFPGTYVWDSFEAWRQGYSGAVSNWQSPLHSYFMGYLTRFGIPLWETYLCQSSLFIVLFLALIRSSRTITLQVGYAVFFTLPTTLVLVTTMWRDSLAVLCLLFWLLAWQKRWVVCGAVALVVMVLFRLNTVLMVPLLAWLALSHLTTVRRAALAFGITVTAAAAEPILENALEVRDVWTIGTTRLFELNYMTIRTPLPQEENFILQHVSAEEQTALEEDCGAWTLVNSGVPAFYPPQLIDHRDAINASWRAAIAANPLDWLDARWRMTRCILRLGFRAPDRPFFTKTDKLNPYNYDSNDSTLRFVLHLWRRLGTIVFFFPYMWFLAGIVLLACMSHDWKLGGERVHLPRRATVTSLLFLAAGTLCEASLFLSAPTSDHRYSAPFEAAVFCAWLLWIDAFVAARRLTAGRR